MSHPRGRETDNGFYVNHVGKFITPAYGGSHFVTEEADNLLRFALEQRVHYDHLIKKMAELAAHARTHAEVVKNDAQEYLQYKRAQIEQMTRVIPAGTYLLSGLISKKANTLSSSYILYEGISPLTILQNIQSFMIYASTTIAVDGHEETASCTLASNSAGTSTPLYSSFTSTLPSSFNSKTSGHIATHVAHIEHFALSIDTFINMYMCKFNCIFLQIYSNWSNL